MPQNVTKETMSGIIDFPHVVSNNTFVLRRRRIIVIITLWGFLLSTWWYLCWKWSHWRTIKETPWSILKTLITSGNEKLIKSSKTYKQQQQPTRNDKLKNESRNNSSLELNEL